MLSLLIVDDEVLIADSLYAMIQEAFQERLAVRRCYTAADAQAIMEKKAGAKATVNVKKPYQVEILKVS